MMMNLVTGIIGIAGLAIFLGFMIWWVKAPPLIIIVVVVLVLLIYDFVQSVREDYAQRGER
jgi:membrane protein implicated in regulation of membrane protease activity